ncbi:unnamed protein product [Parnassius apollo]|uniref:(apollo) hypothetical protein n=1 Tax=Parnassius apollo TaxID=110799 RepID=A0A8S3Y6F0_PARAO|nr:unnamed protein product [Parnassius apollo]
MRHKQKEVKNNEKPEDKQSYNLLTKSIKDRYKKIRSLSEKRLFKSIFNTGFIERSRKKAELLKETLGIHREYRKKPKTNRSILQLRKKIHQFFVRDDVSRATAGTTATAKKRNSDKKWK